MRSDDQTEDQIHGRLWFMRFCGLALHDAVPGAKTIWLYREQLTKAGAIEGLFARRRGARAASYPAMGGPIVDATAAERRRPRLSAAEKATVKGGHVPEHWSKAKRFRWKLARPSRTVLSGSSSWPSWWPSCAAASVMAQVGSKNHLNIDRRHGFIPTRAAAGRSSPGGGATLAKAHRCGVPR